MAKRKTPIKKVVLSSIIIVLIFSTIYYHNQTSFTLDDTNPKTISFNVEKGESIGSIAKTLEELNLIKSAQFFETYTQLHKYDRKIMAGNFLLNTSMNVQEIAQTLTQKPDQAEISFTILEGVRIRDIDADLSKIDLIQPGQFIEATKNFNYQDFPFIKQNNLNLPLEGYIYPDTYFINSKNFHPDQLITKALNNFQTKTAHLNLDPEELHQKLTMASIIENEVFGYQDRQIVAGIFYKRLENNWRLDADASLLYITDDRSITQSDLQIDSPYNTRKNLGIPPGPISNPSIEAIEAALNPKESPYWFYLTTLDTGEVIYSKSNEEHNLNRAKHLY